MSKYYGYTCTTSVKYNREDKEARKKTKQYQLLVSKCSEQQIILEEIYSDLLSFISKSVVPRANIESITITSSYSTI